MSPLNICIISQEFPPYTNWGGIAAYNSGLADIFCKLGHDVTIVSRSENGAPEFEILPSGVKVWRVGRTIKRKYFIGRTIDRIMHAFDVERKVKELDAHKRFDVIEAAEAGLESERLLRSESFRLRIVIQCHGSNFQGVVPDGLLAFLHKLDWKWSFAREKNSIELAQHILVMSEATRDFLHVHGLGNSKTHLIHHGINTCRFSPAGELSSTWLEVGFAGRIEKRKGIDFIWKVMDQIGPDAGIRFHFKGAVHRSLDSEFKEAMHRFKNFSIYHGAGSAADMPNYYRKLHVLLQPSRFESFGLVYIEAMASGLIVIAGVGGSGPEIIEHGRTGYLVDPDEISAPTVARLREIADNLPGFNILRENARKEVQKRFSLETCAKLKIAYYKNQVIQHHRAYPHSK
jgi:glycogen(starch) synthase